MASNLYTTNSGPLNNNEAEAAVDKACRLYSTDPAAAFAAAYELLQHISPERAPLLAARLHNLAAIIYFDAGNYPDALEKTLAALRLSDGQDATLYGSVLNTRAIIAHARGETEAALDNYHAALAMLPVGGRHYNLVASNLAELHLETGKLDKAIEFGNLLIDSTANTPGHALDAEFAIRALDAIAGAHRAKGDRIEAETYLATMDKLIADTVASSKRDRVVELAAAQAWAKHHTGCGNFEAAHDCWRTALDHCLQLGDSGTELKLRSVLADCCKRLSMFEQAFDHQERRFELQQLVFGREADLRLKTLEVAHATHEAEQRMADMAARTQELEHIASTDSLTGLSNRRKFMTLLADTLEQQSHGSLIMFDIDHFKTINDTYGHDVGDIVLRSFATAAADIAGNTRAVARLGGEEFAVLCVNDDIGAATHIAEHIRATFEQLRVPELPDTATTASFGVASLSEASSTSEAMKMSDAALYDAKRTGRNKVSVAASRQSHQDRVKRRQHRTDIPAEDN